jgi:hypothetical protein
MNESRQDPQINNQGPSVDKCERHMTRRAYQNNNEIESERRGSHIQTHQDAGNENGCLTATTPIPGEERGARHRPKRVPMSTPDPCTQDQDKIRTNEEARASRKEPGTDFIPPFGAGTNPGARESRDETGATRERSPMSKDRDPHGEGVEYASMIVPWDWGGKSSEEIAVAPSSSFILERSSIKADSLSLLPLPGEAKPDEIEKGQGQGERLRGAYDTGLEKGGKSIEYHMTTQGDFFKRVSGFRHDGGGTHTESHLSMPESMPEEHAERCKGLSERQPRRHAGVLTFSRDPRPEGHSEYFNHHDAPVSLDESLDIEYNQQELDAILIGLDEKPPINYNYNDRHGTTSIRTDVGSLARSVDLGGGQNLADNHLDRGDHLLDRC